MGEQAVAAAGPWHDRCGRPKAAGALLWLDRCTQALTDFYAVATIALETHRIGRNRPRHKRLAEVFIMCVAAGREHDALAGFHQNFFAVDIQTRANDATPVAGHIDNRRVEQDRHLAFAQTVE